MSNESIVLEHFTFKIKKGFTFDEIITDPGYLYLINYDENTIIEYLLQDLLNPLYMRNYPLYNYKLVRDVEPKIVN